MQQTTSQSTTRGFTVREVRPEDIEQARAVILRVLEEDLHSGYIPEWHWDVDDIQGTYIDNPRQAMFVAVDDASGAVIGTTAIRAGGPKPVNHPQWLCDRYDPETTAQLYRVYIAREHRRRGAARALVDAARRFVRDEGGYTVIYLHTNVTVPEAEPFWRSMPTTEVYDGRHGRNAPVHFELAMDD
jgi:ribosomal protein S18 acetylase RimI-like enzyme